MIHAVPTQVEDIIVNHNEKTITWAAPVEPNGIIVGYRVQYWELGRRDTTEEVNTTAEDHVYSYSTFSKCSIALTILTVQYNSNMTSSLPNPQVQVCLTRCKFKLPLWQVMGRAVWLRKCCFQRSKVQYLSESVEAIDMYWHTVL